MANSLGGLGSGIDEQALLHTHTAYLARLLRVDLEKGVADVQPLTLQKPLGGKGTPQPPVLGVPILWNARYKLGWGETCAAAGGLGRHLVMEPIRAGEIALCVVCERDISGARRGRSETPPAGHHEIKDSVVAGVIV